LLFAVTSVAFEPRDRSKPILDAFATATVPACKAGCETGLERFRLPGNEPGACSLLGAGMPGFSFVLSASLRGIGQIQKKNLSGMTYHEFVLCGKFCFAFLPSGRARPPAYADTRVQAVSRPHWDFCKLQSPREHERTGISFSRSALSGCRLLQVD
jgi:hypothetical protein